MSKLLKKKLQLIVFGAGVVKAINRAEKSTMIAARIFFDEANVAKVSGLVEKKEIDYDKRHETEKLDILF